MSTRIKSYERLFGVNPTLPNIKFYERKFMEWVLVPKYIIDIYVYSTLAEMLLLILILYHIASSDDEGHK